MLRHFACRPLFVFLALLVSACSQGNSGAHEDRALRIGFFYGGRTNMIYRTFVFDFFDREGVEVELHTRNLRGDRIFKVPKRHARTLRLEARLLKKGNLFGKMTGIEIVDLMLQGRFEGGTIGEASFIHCISRGDPITAVAMLGHDVAGAPGKGICLRKGLVIRTPEDFKGKTLISRRAGPGDAVFLREFLRSLGLGSEPSIRIIDQVYEDDSIRLLKEGKIDGGFYHLKTIKALVDQDAGYLYRKMDWLDPELSHALLVFRNDFIESNPGEVARVVRAYVKRIEYERKLPEDRIDRSLDKGMMMQRKFQGMSIPQYDLPPLVRPELLARMQDLLLRHGKISRKVGLDRFVENRFVKEAAP